MRDRLRVIALLVAAGWLVCVTTSAQMTPSPPNPQTSEPQPMFKSSVRNVVLDVVVTDAAGTPVTGLTRDDFRIFEDGALQTVQFFEPPSSHPVMEAAAHRGHAVIVLDELNSKFEDLAFAVDSVQGLLKRTSTLPQSTTLMLLSDRGLTVLGGPTQDSKALLEALRAHKNQISINLRDAVMPFTDVVNLSLGAMEQLARANMNSGDRQSVLWVTAGVNSQSFEGTNSTTDLSDFVHALTLLSDEMLRSRTTVDAVDPRGVGNGRTEPLGIVSGTNTGDEALSQDIAAAANGSIAGTSDLALRTLTTETGGTYLYGHNNVDAEVGQVLTDAAGAYTLAFSPGNHDYNGKFRKLRVSLTGDRRALVVHARPGYYALPQSVTRNVTQVKYDINHAITSQVRYAGIAVSVQTSPASDGKVALTVAVDPRSIEWQLQDDGKYHGQVDLLAVSFSDKQKALVSVKQTRSAQISAAGYQTALSKPWNVELAVPVDAMPSGKMPSGRSPSFVRVVVRDLNSDRIGSAQAVLP